MVSSLVSTECICGLVVDNRNRKNSMQGMQGKMNVFASCVYLLSNIENNNNININNNIYFIFFI